MFDHISARVCEASSGLPGFIQRWRFNGLAAKVHGRLLTRAYPIFAISCYEQYQAGAFNRLGQIAEDCIFKEGDLQDVRRLPGHAQLRSLRFFEATNALEDKKLLFLGWRGPTQAIKTIKWLSR
jgi:hypothetical protein